MKSNNAQIKTGLDEIQTRAEILLNETELNIEAALKYKIPKHKMKDLFETVNGENTQKFLASLYRGDAKIFTQGQIVEKLQRILDANKELKDVTDKYHFTPF